MNGIDRRRFLSTLSAGCLGLTVGGLSNLGHTQPEHPNVILFIIEDLNDWVGCLGGHPDTQTPAIDQFAAGGVLFSNAHCAAPACNPSRTGIFSGLRPSTSGVYFNEDDWRVIISPDHPMLPQLFRAAGYYTARYGKGYHQTFIQPSHWDEMYNVQSDHILPGLDPFVPGHPFQGTNDRIQANDDFLWGPTDVSVTDMHDSRIIMHSLQRLPNLPQPFFTVIGTHKTHWPAIVPREYFERFPLSEVDLPPFLEGDLNDIPPAGVSLTLRWRHHSVVEHKQWRKAVQAYLAAIAFIDDMVSVFLDGISGLPGMDNTIVIMASDHGYHLGEKRHWRKWTLWQESTHSLLALQGPGVVWPGTEIDEAVSLSDIYPTLIDLCNLQDVPACEALSLVPFLLNPTAHRVQPALTTYGPGNHAVVDERWRYIRYADGSDELYDHQNDPNEWTNLAGDPQYQWVIDQLSPWIPNDG